MSLIPGPKGKDVHRISCKKLTAQQLSPWETNTLNSWISPMYFHSKQYPPAFSFFFIEQCSSSLFVGLAYYFCQSLLVLNCSSVLFPNKSIFAYKITDIFFKSAQWCTECNGMQYHVWGYPGSYQLLRHTKALSTLITSSWGWDGNGRLRWLWNKGLTLPEPQDLSRMGPVSPSLDFSPEMTQCLKPPLEFPWNWLDEKKWL